MLFLVLICKFMGVNWVLLLLVVDLPKHSYMKGYFLSAFCYLTYLLQTPFCPVKVFLTIFSNPRGESLSGIFYFSRLQKLTYFQFMLLFPHMVNDRFSIAHPYLIADNRHYPFYLWRKVINAHWSMKYLLVLPYVYSWFSIFITLGQYKLLSIFVTNTFFPTFTENGTNEVMVIESLHPSIYSFFLHH